MFGFTKGKIQFILHNFSYKPGDTIRGAITMTLKKDIEAEAVSIKLIAQERVQTGNGSSYKTIYDFKYPLDVKKIYPHGSHYNYDFKLVIPSDVLNKAPLGVANTFVKAAQFLSKTRRVVYWSIVARLEVKGFDIKKKVKIQVN